MFEWKQTGDDPNDIIATPRAFQTLRVERLSEGSFWWCVYIGFSEFDCWDYGMAGKNLEDAKAKCVELYNMLTNEKS